jgi:hypothetical protein
MGIPYDREGQLQVLRAVFKAIIAIENPGTVIHLPYKVSEHGSKALDNHYAPPIATHLKKNIRQIPKFIRREIPPEYKV